MLPVLNPRKGKIEEKSFHNVPKGFQVSKNLAPSRAGIRIGDRPNMTHLELATYNQLESFLCRFETLCRSLYYRWTASREFLIL